MAKACEQKSLSAVLSNAALIVAHPDDEILWFSSLLEDVARIIVCYGEVPGQPEWSRGRAEIVDKFPLQNTMFLGLTESVAFGVANWNDPTETAHGLRLDQPDRAFDGFSARRYQTNFEELCQRLPSLISDYSTVITHNPWGEYGHEEHVQVYRAACSVAAGNNQDVWYSNYVSDRSAPLMVRTLARSQEYTEVFTTKPEIAAPIEKLYREHGCWTWPFDDYEYFATETFVLDPGLNSSSGRVGNRLALNYLDVDGGGLADKKQAGVSDIRKKFRRFRQGLRGGGAR